MPRATNTAQPMMRAVAFRGSESARCRSVIMRLRHCRGRPSELHSRRHCREADPPAEKYDCDPEYERKRSGDPPRERGGSIAAPLGGAAAVDQRKNQHVDAGHKHQSELDPKCEVAEICLWLADEHRGAADPCK